MMAAASRSSGTAYRSGQLPRPTRHPVHDAGLFRFGQHAPPRAFIQAAPSRPSAPMPVITTPSTRSPYTSAADWNSTSTDGRWGIERPDVESNASFGPPHSGGASDDVRPARRGRRPGRTLSPSRASTTAERRRLVEALGVGLCIPDRHVQHNQRAGRESQRAVAE